MDYLKTVSESKKHGETNDCAVKALSIACDVSYSVAHKLLKMKGRRNRCGTMRGHTLQSIGELGFTYEQVAVSAKTVSSIPKDKTFRDGYYMVFVSGHVLAVVNGAVQDWTDGRRHKIKGVIKVAPIKTRRERRAIINGIMSA